MIQRHWQFWEWICFFTGSHSKRQCWVSATSELLASLSQIMEHEARCLDWFSWINNKLKLVFVMMRALQCSRSFLEFQSFCPSLLCNSHYNDLSQRSTLLREESNFQETCFVLSELQLRLLSFDPLNSLITRRRSASVSKEQIYRVRRSARMFAHVRIYCRY